MKNTDAKTIIDSVAIPVVVPSEDNNQRHLPNLETGSGAARNEGTESILVQGSPLQSPADKDTPSQPAPADATATTEPNIVEIPAQPLTPEEIASGEKKRGRGRPPGTKNKPRDSTSIIADPSAENVSQVDYRLLSETIFDTGTGTLAVAFGPEWNAKNPDERNAVCQALQRYLAHKQVQDIPPGMMLSIVLLAYSAPRLQAEPTKTKLQMLWLKTKSLFQRKKKVAVTL